jgi:superfamily II DNA/RNA helicase
LETVSWQSPQQKEQERGTYIQERVLENFDDAGIDPRTQAALAASDIHSPVPVQAEAIPPLLEGRDGVIQAPTGSGKTLAFLVPLVEGIRKPGPGPRALVVTPTRELAMQVSQVLETLDHGTHSVLLYGGVGYATQTAGLKRGADVVIGTPGRILDMIGRKLLSLSRVEYLVLDEADEMLDAGFAPDVERILGLTYQPQTVLASATMPTWVEKVIDRFLSDPVRVRVSGGADEIQLEHGLVQVDRDRKLTVLSRLLQRLEGTAIVFGRTKHGVSKLNRDLRRLGVHSAELQGDLSQQARDRTMASFREGRLQVLVATNVAARGLDISQVTLVVNYELPDTPDWLTHRVGRTARMGERGWALTFVCPEDRMLWHRLRRQGAPDLRPVDVTGLLEGGPWRYLDHEQPATVPAGASDNGRRPSGARRRQRPGRTFGSGRPPRREAV